VASHDATDSPVGASRGLLLTLRGRAGLSQRELAALLGVSERAIQAWEGGLSYPSATSLQRLIALHVERGTFTAGREAEEAAALWQAARSLARCACGRLPAAGASPCSRVTSAGFGASR
jgi:DNA-binding XRE family transcriptional regulator